MTRLVENGGTPGLSGPLHLLKMAVGVADLDELRRARAARIEQHGGSWIYTRNHPRRTASVLAGGSLYWVIRGQIRVRQPVVGFHSERDDKGRAYCLIEVDPRLVPTLWRPWRPFQGWRYLTPGDAPPDAQPGVMPDVTPGAAPELPDGNGAPRPAEAIPERMLAELRALGLL